MQVFQDIKVENINKKYNLNNIFTQVLVPNFLVKNKFNYVHALININFNIKKGETVGIIGVNGSGKSTLLQIISGTLTQTSGIIQKNRKVSALLELGSGFKPEYTGIENIILNGLILGLSKNEIKNKLDQILDFADIGDAVYRPVQTYSSGMMMRLAFSVQVICDPEILIIDEALSVGDFFFQQKCYEYIKSLIKKDITLIFVSHDMSVVRDLCHRVIFLKNGSIEYDGDTKGGILKYLNEKNSTQSDTFRGTESNNKDGVKIKYLDAIWKNPNNIEEGKIIAIRVLNSQGTPSSFFKMAEEICLEIYFKGSLKDSNHISIFIYDKFKSLKTVTGSLQLGLKGVKNNQVNVFKTYIKLMLEAGEYSLGFNLGYQTQKNQGIILHEINDLGPIQINWDYENDTAPFLGQVGLPCKAIFS